MDYTNNTELWKYQWDLIHDPESMLFSALQDESEGASSASNGQYVKSYINNILCLRKQGIYSYADPTFQYRMGVSMYDAATNLTFMDNKNYGNVFMWANSFGPININNITTDGSKVIVGNKTENYLTFEIRSGNSSTETLAENLKTYLKADWTTHESEIESLLSKMDKMSDIQVMIAKLPSCTYDQISKERRVDYLKKLVTYETDYNYTRKIINSTPIEHIPEIFNALKKDELFKKLDEKLYNKSYEYFYLDLHELWKLGYISKLKENPAILKCLPLLWSTWNCFMPYTTNLPNSNSIYIKGTCSDTRVTLDLFDDIIYIDCNSTFRGEELSYPIIVPAFFWRLATKENISTVINTSFDVGLDIGSWWIGVGELNAAWKAGKILKKIMAVYGVYDASIDIADATMNFSDEVKSKIIAKYPETGKKIITSWELCNFFIDYGMYFKSIHDDDLTFSTATFKKSYETLRTDPKFQQILGVEYIKLEKFYIETSKIKK